MTRKKYLMDTWDSYFKKLDGIAQHMDNLREVIESVEDLVLREQLWHNFYSMREEFRSHVEHLGSSGVRIVEKYA